jgi:hypothetical protein
MIFNLQRYEKKLKYKARIINPRQRVLTKIAGMPVGAENFQLLQTQKTAKKRRLFFRNVKITLLFYSLRTQRREAP